MLNANEAFRKLINSIQPVHGSETISVSEAHGRFTAMDIAAPMDLPPFKSSAMDGYAVSTSDLNAVVPFKLNVIGESRAGHPSSDKVSGRNAIRIFTGAVVPSGADAVVLQENVNRVGNTIEVNEPPHPGDHIRPRGHDIRKKAMLVPAGTSLDAYRLSWLTACGIPRVNVKPRVSVAVFSTGDELVDVGSPLSEGQIYDSNRFALSTLMSDQPIRLIDVGRLPDDRDEIRSRLQNVAREADMIVTSGGVSVGDSDFVRNVVEEIGRLDFWKLALKPGKPLAVGKIGKSDFFGLPGNPISTIVTYLLFVAPAICVRAGGTASPPLEFRARLTTTIFHTRGRLEYQRGIVRNHKGELIVSATGDQSSNRLMTFSGANCLIKVPEENGNINQDETVSIVLLERHKGQIF